MIVYGVQWKCRDILKQQMLQEQIGAVGQGVVLI